MNFYQGVAFYVTLIVCSRQCTVANFIFEYNPGQTSLVVRMIYDNYWIEKIVYNQNHYNYRHHGQHVWLYDLTPCTQYALDVYYAYNNNYNTYSKHQLEQVTTLIGTDSPIKFVNTVQQTLSSMTVELVCDRIDCVNSLEVLLNNTNVLIFTKYNITKQFRLHDLLPCAKYAMTILLNHQYVAYNEYIRTTPKELQPIQSIYYYSETDLLKWSPTVLEDCTSKYVLQITPEPYYSNTEAFTLNTTSNVHQVDWLPRCTQFMVLIYPEGHAELNGTIRIITGSKVPGPVTKLSAHRCNETTITIGWNEPVANPKCVKAYRIKINEKEWITIPQLEYTVNENKLCAIHNIVVCASPDRESCANYTFDSSEYDTNYIKNVSDLILDVDRNSVTTLFWYARSQDDQCIEHYVVTLYDELQQRTYHANVKNTSITISNLVLSRTHQLHIETVPVHNRRTMRIQSVFLIKAKPQKPEPPPLGSNFGRKVQKTHDGTFGLYPENVTSKSFSIFWRFRPDKAFYIIITKIKSLDKVSPLCEHIGYNHTFTVHAHIRNHTFDDLQPNSNYSIRAECVIKNSLQREEIFVATQPGVPHRVKNLQITNTTTRSVTLSWELPCTINGKIRRFNIKTNGTNPTNLEHHITRLSLLINAQTNKQKFYFTVSSIRPLYNYNISVAIILENVQGIKNKSTIRFSPEEYRENEIGSLNDWGYITIIDYANATLKINKNLFRSRHSELTLHIYELHCERDCKRDCNFDKIPELVQITLNKDIARDCVPINGDRIELKREIEYEISATINTTKVYTVTKSIIFKGPPFSRFDHSLILYIGVTLLFLAVIVILSILCATYENKVHEIAALQSTYIEVEHFSYFYNLCDHNVIAYEYQSIDDMDLDHLTKIESKNNRSKNRYTDIVPYDHNRVILTPNEYCPTDYINASYIDGYKGENRYIATQGPKDETAYDFWHMVVSTKCEKIIMLTQLEENGVTKCSKYYPNLDETLVLNDLTITNVIEMNFGNFMQRALVIAQYGGMAKRFVIHYQYLVWPDRDCPAKPADLIEFIEFTKCSTNKSIQPVIVHCSAGVGRTGTFIALDLLFQNFHHEKYLSVCETVRMLRKQRRRMVQTRAQYDFLYSTINLYWHRFVYKYNY